MSHGGNAPFDLNVASLFFASLTFLTVGGFTVYRKDLTNRVSFRLQGAIAVADIGNHLAGMYYAALPEGSLCAFTGFWRTFGRGLFCFYNIALALNLQLVFLHNYIPKAKTEIAYWIVPLLVALVLNVPFLAMGEFGKEKGFSSYCFIKYPKSTSGKAINILNINTVLLLTFIYCTVVAVLVIIKINTTRNTLATMEVTGGDNRKAMIRKQLKSLVIRVALYPIVTIVALSGYLVLQFTSVVNPASIGITVTNWSIYTSNLTGTLNFLAFIMDPFLHNAILTVYKDIRFGKVSNLSFPDKEFENKLDLEEGEGYSNLDFYNDSECRKMASKF